MKIGENKHKKSNAFLRGVDLASLTEHPATICANTIPPWAGGRLQRPCAATARPQPRVSRRGKLGHPFSLVNAHPWRINIQNLAVYARQKVLAQRHQAGKLYRRPRGVPEQYLHN